MLDHNLDALYQSEPANPLDTLLAAERQAVSEWNDNQDRPEFKRYGKRRYIRRRRSHLLQ